MSFCCRKGAWVALLFLTTAVSAQTTRITSGRPLVLPASGRPIGEPHLVIDPTRPKNLLGAAIVHDAAANLGDSSRARVRCVTLVSRDDGEMWRQHTFDIAGCFDPNVGVTPAGDAVFVALGRDHQLQQKDDELIVYHSPDGGESWDAQPTALGRGHDHPVVIVDRSSPKRANWLYVVSSLSARDSGVLRFGVSVARSRNGGRTFDPPVLIRPSNLMVLAEDPAVLSDGTLIISYVEAALGDGRTQLTRRRAWVMESGNGGLEFSQPRFVNDACGSSTAAFSLSALVADGSEGTFHDRLYFACNQATPPAVVLSWSANRGETWSVPTAVHGAVADTAASRKVMAMAVNKLGVLGVAWIESGRNPAGPCAEDVHFAASVDGGQTFLPSALVASAASCPGRELNGQAWSGDYFGMTADDQGRFRLLWSGVRDRLLTLHFSTIEVTGAVGPPR